MTLDMMIVSPLVGLLDLPSVKSDAGGGGSGFAPLMAGLLGPEITTDCTSLPPGGEKLPVAALSPDDFSTPSILIAGSTPVTAASESAGITASLPTVTDVMPSAASPWRAGSKVGGVTDIEAASTKPLRVMAGGKSAAPGRKTNVVAEEETEAAAPPPVPADMVTTPVIREPNLIASPSLPTATPVTPASGPSTQDAPSRRPSSVGSDVRTTPPIIDARSMRDTAVVPDVIANAQPVAGPVPTFTFDAKPTPRFAAPTKPTDVIATRSDGGAISPAMVAILAAPVTPGAETVARPSAEVTPSRHQHADEPSLADIPVSPRPAPDAVAAAPVILPALQAFAAAIRRAMADERKLALPRDDAGIGLATPAGPAAAMPPQTVVQSSATLDTNDQHWPHAMAAQIEKLRDAADSQSTRIRLLPDALGPVDVAVRRDGEQVHVHFTAADAQTRQLLVDAQPRLADAAEARGVKLGRTDVSGGDLPNEQREGGDRQQQRPTAQNPQPSRPAPARIRATATDTDDSRLA